MRLDDWLRPPRHLLGLFLVVTVGPAIALAWLSWRILEQDRALATQRVQERIEHAADLITAAIERRLAGLEAQLPALAASPPANFPDDSLIVTVTGADINAYPRHRLLWQPVVPRIEEAPARAWETGEVFEFQRQDDGGGRPNPHLDAAIHPLHLSPDERTSLLAFLQSLSGQIAEGSLALSASH